uniref:Uncharacterized protein n=1 Tax=Chromera velia CCMP2878 TaxID=1169474 RepID=A0A0G4FDU9_9ALVE|eukprot:Cvel_16397.t1-p1 / transcript=Cvel_16397.t1 / gene=Cvel_16397 / organism=Chromera_velia_CCMP2878 / gene_product=hypothetical protein / transcript_product=hypothetical protein / location=Cvel_scaffold1262:18187-22226(-) / protein_length=701 / sequence_SO=supercontig / SO=protein_coding / is_pseudo=false
MSEGFRESHDEKRFAPWMEKFYSSSDVFPHEVLFLAWICSNGEGLPDFSGSDEAFECAFDPTAFLSLADTLQKWPLGGVIKRQRTTRGRPKASELTSGKPVSAFSETSSLPVASDSDQRCSKEEHELRSTDRMGHLIQGQPPRPSSPSRASCQRCEVRVRVVNSHFNFHTEVVEGLIDLLHQIGCPAVLFNEDFGFLPHEILTRAYERSDGPAEAVFFTTADTMEAMGLKILPAVLKETGARAVFLVVHETFYLRFVRKTLEEMDLPSEVNIRLVTLNPNVANRVEESVRMSTEGNSWIPQVSREVLWLFLAKRLPVRVSGPPSTPPDTPLWKLVGKAECSAEFSDLPEAEKEKQKEKDNSMAGVLQERFDSEKKKKKKNNESIQPGWGMGRRQGEPDGVVENAERKETFTLGGLALQGSLNSSRRNYSLPLNALFWYKRAIAFCDHLRTLLCTRSRLFWFFGASRRFQFQSERKNSQDSKNGNSILTSPLAENSDDSIEEERNQNSLSQDDHAGREDHRLLDWLFLKAVGRIDYDPWALFTLPKHLRLNDTQQLRMETDLYHRTDFVLENACSLALLTAFPSLLYHNGRKTSSTIQLAISTGTPLHGHLKSRKAFSWLHGDMDAIGWWSASHVSFFETLRRTSWGQYLQKRANVESAHRQLVSESAERLLTAVEKAYSNSSRGSTQGGEIDARLVQEVAR